MKPTPVTGLPGFVGWHVARQMAEGYERPWSPGEHGSHSPGKGLRGETANPMALMEDHNFKPTATGREHSRAGGRYISGSEDPTLRETPRDLAEICGRKPRRVARVEAVAWFESPRP